MRRYVICCDNNFCKRVICKIQFLCIYTVFVCKYYALITNQVRILRHFLCIYTFFVCSAIGVKEYLNSRITYILPDKGQYENWVEESKRFHVKGKVLDFIETMDVERNTDIALAY